MHRELLAPAHAAAGDLPTPLPPFRWRSVVTGVPPVVWWALVLYWLVLFLWSVVTPLYRVTDEPGHIDRTIAAVHGDIAPVPGSRMIGEEVAGSYRQQGFTSCCPPYPSNPLLRAQATPRAERPSYAKLGGLHAPSTWRNQLTQHPPLYYVWEGAVLKALPGDLSYDKTANLLRLASAVLVLPLPLLLYGAARRFAGRGPVATTAALLPLAVPEFAHLGAGVTNDDLLLLLGGVLALLLAHVLTGDTSARTAVWVGIVVALALLTKAFGFVAFVAVLLAYGLAWVRARGAPEARYGGVVATVVGLVLGGWWWVRNLVLFHTLQPDGGNIVIPTKPGFHPSAAHYFLQGYPNRMWTSLWGNFGWLERPLPPAAVWTATGLVVLGALLALRRAPTRRWRWSWADVVVLLTPIVLLYWSIGARGFKGFARTGQAGGNQGRYLFFGAAALLLVAALGAAKVSEPWRGRIPRALLLGAGAMQALGMWDVLYRFYGAHGASFTYRVSDLLAWSPWPPPLVWLTVAMIVLVGAAAFRAAVVSRRVVTAAP